MTVPSERPAPKAVPPGPRLKLRRRQRLSLATDFRSILKGKHSRPSGPLVVYGRTSTLDIHRLGLSIGRRVGNAVVRNRIKRRLREAFRHAQHTLPRTRAGESLDVVIVVRPHDALSRAEYEQHLTSACAKLVADLDRRARRAAEAGESA